MKRSKGFTLIELLAVIAILGILVSITTVAVNTLRKNQEAKNKLNVISSILTGAKEYNAKEKIPLNKKDENNNSYGEVEVNTLIDGNYVDFDENKYPELIKFKKNGREEDIVVTKTQCSNNKLKIKYSIKVGKDTYNDCGCEEQPEDGSSTKSNELCTQ